MMLLLLSSAVATAFCCFSVATTSAGLLLLLELDLARHPGEAADSAMLASRSSQLSNLMKYLSLTDPSLPTRCWLLAAGCLAGGGDVLLSQWDARDCAERQVLTRQPVVRRAHSTGNVHRA